MIYPLTLRFRILTLTPTLEVFDANGAPVLYVRQKLFRLKEQVEVFRDSSRAQKLFTINANKIIDFSASYRFTASDGADWGAVQRHGMKSLWSAHYEITDIDQPAMLLQEEAPWKKFVESILGEIPIIGFIAIYLICPSYVIRQNNEIVFRTTKRPSIFERNFIIDKLRETDEETEMRALLGLLMMVMLERKRG